MTVEHDEKADRWRIVAGPHREFVGTTKMLGVHMAMTMQALAECEAERDKLALFKRNTHILLDEAGAPAFADQECRVSHRIRWMAGQIASHKADVKRATPFLRAYMRNTLSNEEEPDDEVAHLHADSAAWEAAIARLGAAVEAAKKRIANFEAGLGSSGGTGLRIMLDAIRQDLETASK